MPRKTLSSKPAALTSTPFAKAVVAAASATPVIPEAPATARKSKPPTVTLDKKAGNPPGRAKPKGMPHVPAPTPAPAPAPVDPFRESKQAYLIALLRNPAGASIEQMMTLTGWQAHTVRGTISGVLRKKLGLNVICEPAAESGTRCYRIIGSAA